LGLLNDLGSKKTMCRILAIKNFYYTKHKEIIEKFFLLAEDSRVPPGNLKGHLDSWGVGWCEMGKNLKLNDTF